MQYLTKKELRALFAEAYKSNRQHHLALVVSLWHATRVSELLEIRAKDVVDGFLTVQGLKGSEKTRQEIRIDSDPLFDCSGLIELAKNADSPDSKLFTVCRQRLDQVIRKYGQRAGIDPSKAHMHALRHSAAMLLWEASSGNIGLVQRHLRHKSPSSSLIYLRELDSQKASAVMNGIQL